MSQVASLLLLGMSTLLLSPPAFADLPVLGSEANENGGDNKNRFVELLGLDIETLNVLRKGVIPFNFGAVHYRTGTKALKTSFTRGILSVNAQLGYDGRHRLEFGWPSLGGTFKFTVAGRDDGPAYRFQFKAEF